MSSVELAVDLHDDTDDVWLFLSAEVDNRVEVEKMFERDVKVDVNVIEVDLLFVALCLM
jgi:hypothetical protein